MSPAQRAARERMVDGLRRHRTDAIETISRRSLKVSVMKKALPVVATLLLVALALAPSIHLGPGANRVSYKVQSNTGNSSSRMQNAKYHGVDMHGQPFLLTAVTANEQGADDVVLDHPQGDITLTSGAWLFLRSNAGLFHQSSQALGLTGDVSLYRNDGTTMTAPTANINMRLGTAETTAPVQVQGPFGTLNAAHGFTLTDRGTDVVFHGPATLVLTQAGSLFSTPQ